MAEGTEIAVFFYEDRWNVSIEMSGDIRDISRSFKTVAEAATYVEKFCVDRGLQRPWFWAGLRSRTPDMTTRQEH